VLRFENEVRASAYTIIQTELRTVVNAMFTKPLCCEAENLPVRGPKIIFIQILRLVESKSSEV
jgi:hypothetical protein